MRNRTWTYTGNIGSYACQKNCRGEMIISEIELHDMMDDAKAPVLLHVCSSLINYILDIENNDDEERYMRKEFVYDEILCIREIRILNRDGKVCKIVKDADELNWMAAVTGPVERITDENQKALSGNETIFWVGPEVFSQR